MTDPALIGHLRILEAKLDRLTEAINRVADAIEASNDDHDPHSLKRLADALETIENKMEAHR